MLFANSDVFIAPVRKIIGKVELYTNSSTEPIVYTHNGSLKSVKVERLGESKFFGFGVSQKANIKILDKERTCAPTTADYAIIYFRDGDDKDIRVTPKLYVTEVHRDETTNEVSITLYDRLYDASNHTIAELGLPESYSITQLLDIIANFMGVTAYNVYGGDFVYEGGANLDSNTTLREVLDDVAEATQTMYYLSAYEELLFTRLVANPEEETYWGETIDKSQYFKLDSKTNRRLTSIISATELGDNVEITTGLTGTTQIVQDNAFWTHDSVDVAQELDKAIEIMGDRTIAQFECEWRGNAFLEPGDPIAFEVKDGSKIYSYLINDTWTYDGSFSEKTEWIYSDEEVDHANPVSLGDALKQTIAKVDKANQRIDLTVISTTEVMNSLTEEMEELTKKVGLTVNKEAVEIMIDEAVGEGANKVTTSTGFTFNEEGLTVSKSDSDISTTITEDGMTVKKGSDEVLTANNEGVKAIDLHATTYLVIGNNSRFEDYGNRTACFWIGG